MIETGQRVKKCVVPAKWFKSNPNPKLKFKKEKLRTTTDGGDSSILWNKLSTTSLNMWFVSIFQ